MVITNISFNNFFSSFFSYRDAIKARKIQSVEELADAVYLVYSNCEKYNEPSSEIGLEAKRQRTKFDRLLRSVQLSNSTSSSATVNL